MKTLWFIGRYLPLPQPMSNPTEPGLSEERNDSTIGHGYITRRVSNAVRWTAAHSQGDEEWEEATHTLYRVDEK